MFVYPVFTVVDGLAMTVVFWFQAIPIQAIWQPRATACNKVAAAIKCFQKFAQFVSPRA